ncbi:Dabb family protein [Leptolyngbya sp. 7M]|uniref:Dabb family protein n=1 Tax=Leptolyngbya sp. 7M TaxID=2812896 RepID=UPI001B8B011A|nr:Dabb family protein [Leptolyngbya sp. 7M]QYO65394.1 Dabb family protein [Leptolyngbya sp. 7M]
MIVHIVCWKYKAETSAAERAEHISRLNALRDVIPRIISFQVGSDVLQLDRSFDTGLVAVFPDRTALEAYSVHPEHQKVAELGRELAQQAVSVDFETEEYPSDGLARPIDPI